MATQKDLDVLKQKLSDLDVKLRSMGGGSAKRNHRFDLEMANQNYANFMRDQQARLAAERGQYTQGRLMGAPSGGQDFIDSRDPNKKYAHNMVDYIDPATGEKVSRTRGVIPAPGSRFVPVNQAGMYGQRASQGSQVGGGLGGLTADQAGIPVDQRKILDDLMARQKADIAARELEQQNMMKEGKFTIGGTSANPIYGTMAGPVYANGSLVNPPKAQDQAAINNIRAQFDQFLKQGIDRSNTMNQDAATNFANMQAGMPATEPATSNIAKPTMPIAGMGMQKSKVVPQKFSTVNNTPARFF